MTGQEWEWEDMQAEELQQNIDEFNEYLLNKGFAKIRDQLIPDLEETKEIWQSEYGLNLSEVVQAWGEAHNKQKARKRQ